MQNNKNIAIYGYGSKFTLIDTIIRDKLSEYPLLIFYGFFPTISLKAMINTIEKLIIELGKNVEGIITSTVKRIKSYKSIDEHLAIIQKDLELIKVEKIGIVIHNIDGKNLMDEKTQDNLSKIAALKKVSMNFLSLNSFIKQFSDILMIIHLKFY